MVIAVTCRGWASNIWLMLQEFGKNNKWVEQWNWQKINRNSFHQSKKRAKNKVSSFFFNFLPSIQIKLKCKCPLIRKPYITANKSRVFTQYIAYCKYVKDIKDYCFWFYGELSTQWCILMGHNLFIHAFHNLFITI